MSIVIKCDISIIEPNLYYIVDIDAHIVLSKGYASYEDADDEAVESLLFLLSLLIVLDASFVCL